MKQSNGDRLPSIYETYTSREKFKLNVKFST